ncbi:MAG: FxsA cytoplasmic rane protein [Proteobacteria bacterium]|nr:FxsA cytoplasmic rane protein [Pseudomonadota bacterium]
MNIAQGLLLALLSLPILEIYLLIQVGGILGFLPTVFLLMAAASAGAYLLQTQSWSTWQKVQASVARGELPAAELIEGALIMAGGILLLLPGFLSDIVGLFCLIPYTRRILGRYLMKSRYGLSEEDLRDASGPKVIEGEFKRED